MNTLVSKHSKSQGRAATHPRKSGQGSTHQRKNWLSPSNETNVLWQPTAAAAVEQKEEQKTTVFPNDNLTISRSFARDSGFSKSLMKPIKVKLFSNPLISFSAVNTALSSTNNYTFAAANFPEITNYSALYDEARVLSVKVFYQLYVSTLSASLGGAFGGLVISYDPTASAPSSMSTTLSTAHNTGPIWVCQSFNTPLTVTIPHGHMSEFHARTPGPLAPITSSDIPGSAWFAVDGGTAPIIFQLGRYITALGASGISTVAEIIELECEFRLRV